jgi:hypothetical protein
MDKQTYLIELEGVPEDVAGRYADELRNALLDSSGDLMAELKRGKDNTQDFGSTVVLILGAPAVVVAAKALGDYVKLRRSVRLKITTPDGRQVEVDNATSSDAKSIVQMLQGTK